MFFFEYLWAHLWHWCTQVAGKVRYQLSCLGRERRWGRGGRGGGVGWGGILTQWRGAVLGQVDQHRHPSLLHSLSFSLPLASLTPLGYAASPLWLCPALLQGIGSGIPEVVRADGLQTSCFQTVNVPDYQRLFWSFFEFPGSSVLLVYFFNLFFLFSFLVLFCFFLLRLVGGSIKSAFQFGDFTGFG